MVKSTIVYFKGTELRKIYLHHDHLFGSKCLLYLYHSQFPIGEKT